MNIHKIYKNKTNKNPQKRRLVTNPGDKIVTIIIVIILTFAAFATVYPVYFTLNSSLKNQAAWSASKFSLPVPPYFENFTTAWRRAKVPRTFFNSLFTTFGGVILCYLVCILAAFSSVKLKFKGRNALFIFLVASMMVPIQTILYPFFKIMNDFHLTDQYLGLILAYTVFGIPITVYQLAAYLKRIPDSLIEAAKIDGASTLRIIFFIIMPLARPVVITVSLINFAWMWNDLLLPIMILQSPKMQTMIVSLAQLRGQYGTFPTLISAGVFIGIIPVSVVYLVAQRQIIKGMTIGAVKG
jgi:ABC-type glycerol-3-phosphate transport system permease component